MPRIHVKQRLGPKFVTPEQFHTHQMATTRSKHPTPSHVEESVGNISAKDRLGPLPLISHRRSVNVHNRLGPRAPQHNHVFNKNGNQTVQDLWRHGCKERDKSLQQTNETVSKEEARLKHEGSPELEEGEIVETANNSGTSSQLTSLPSHVVQRTVIANLEHRPRIKSVICREC